MGITGLLPFLEKASEKINVESLANKTVAIDSYCWLHKGAFAVADRLARGEETDVHILYCLKYVNMLLSHKIKPILVFDGRHLPAKADTEAKRRESRKNAKQMAIELMRKGKHNEARNYLRRCVDVTHEMALQLIQACRQINVDCIVAPYEADGQLAYLCKAGIADYVITEDSDLVLFGCKRILFKLDLFGSCTLVDATKLHLAMGCREDKFTMEKFRFMCILSGCDYVDSLPGIGLAKACKFILKTEETDMMRALDKIPAYLNMRQLTVTEEYKMNVMKAYATFQHMVVYDPLQRKQVRLYDPNETGTDIELCCNAGVILDDKTSLDLAVGNLNPFSMKRLDNWHPDHREAQKSKPKNLKHLIVAKHPSIWQKGWKPQSNGFGPQQTTLLKNMSKSQRLPDKAKCSQPLAFVESDVDEEAMALQEAENTEDLLNEYSKERDPPQKKFKADVADIEDANREAELHSVAATSRNPFKKESSVTESYQSPTKITSANSSLIKNQSPIKMIDYRRVEKLSKFSRTVISNKQNVISRFFVGPTGNDLNPIEDTRKMEDAPVSGLVPIETENKLEEPDVQEPHGEHMVKCLYLSTSGDSAISLGIENGSAIVQGIVGESGGKNEDSNEKTDTNGNLSDECIVLSENEDTSQEGPSSQTKIGAKSSQRPNGNAKIGSRRPGLSLKNSRKRPSKPTATESTSIQSKLSMFGFQKRPQAL